MIPVTVLITALNEEQNLPRCLSSVLKSFDEVIVVDSNSTDGTKKIANQFGVPVIPFTWNGAYPKKRQWCLDNLNLKHDWVFFLDADEFVTPVLTDEIKSLPYNAVGYFIKGSYVWRSKTLKHGLKNNKLVLFDRRKVEFPVIDDLDIQGMGEMEGHYQPVLKPDCTHECLGRLKFPLLHYAYEDEQGWHDRHKRYAEWEAQMIKRNAYPKDPDVLRQRIKSLFRRAPYRGIIAFLHSYIMKLGFLDGRAGFLFAKSRYDYYVLVRREFKSCS